MSATAPAVFITVPKYVAISPTSSSLPKIRPAPSPVLINTTQISNDECAPKGKKRRLDHLSWEEKVQRKKLKNRVAAQTSRDRKKARMEEMEHEIKELNQKTDILQNKCESLQVINDSLLEKNQKLDMEVEMLRQQLMDLQQQHKQQQKNALNVNNPAVITCTGCESIINGSAAGITSNGLTVDTSTTEKEHYVSSTLEDCCPLPTLQDMLLIDDEFDAGKLEELAESLLADITADMETSDRTCSETAAKVASRTERLPGSVVGSTTECMESSEHSTTLPQSSSLNTPDNILDTNEHPMDTFTLQTKLDINENKVKIEPSTTITTSSVNIATVTPDTVYGTYDAKSNSITIVLDDDAVPVSEAVEEIYCDGVSPPIAEDCIKCPSPASPSQIYLSVDCSDDEDDMDFDPISKFLCPRQPLISPLAKSPSPSLHSATSDHGYESIIGSPTPTSLEHFDAGIEDFTWNGSFNELFPTLV